MFFGISWPWFWLVAAGVVMLLLPVALWRGRRMVYASVLCANLFLLLLAGAGLTWRIARRVSFDAVEGAPLRRLSSRLEFWGLHGGVGVQLTRQLEVGQDFPDRGINIYGELSAPNGELSGGDGVWPYGARMGMWYAHGFARFGFQFAWYKWRDLKGKSEWSFASRVPVWFVCLLLAAPPLALGRRFLRKLRSRRCLSDGLCVRCGFDLRAHAVGDKCPECGTPKVADAGAAKGTSGSLAGATASGSAETQEKRA